MPEVQKLRRLAAWYREFADRAGDPAIWDLRLRTAEDLEATADQLARRGTIPGESPAGFQTLKRSRNYPAVRLRSPDSPKRR